MEFLFIILDILSGDAGRRERDRKELLRPAEPPENHLLRPVGEFAETLPEELLRASD